MNQRRRKKSMARKMRGLYRRGKIWWCCYLSASGRMVRESTTETDHTRAVDFLMKRRTEVAAGKAPEEKKITNHTFNELCEQYLKWAERQKSFETKATFIEQLQEEFGDIPLRRFTSLLLEQYQTKRLGRGKTRKYAVKKPDGTTVIWESRKEPQGNKPATINRHIATIKHMFTKAVEWEMAEEDVLKRIRKVKLLKENNRRLRYLSVEECQALLMECDLHVRPIVTVALNTGMRKGEILGLRWENVDLKQGFILLEQEHTKNGERREIPINTAVRNALQGITRRLDVPHVFHDSETGKPYQDVKKGFNGACRRAGIKDFHFHDLRHTFASHLVMAGQDLTTVKELLGHKTLTMTLRYAHLAPSHKVKAVDILNGILNENSTSHLLHNLKPVEK
jgi:integrase